MEVDTQTDLVTGLREIAAWHRREYPEAETVSMTIDEGADIIELLVKEKRDLIFHLSSMESSRNRWRDQFDKRGEDIIRLGQLAGKLHNLLMKRIGVGQLTEADEKWAREAFGDLDDAQNAVRVAKQATGEE